MFGLPVLTYFALKSVFLEAYPKSIDLIAGFGAVAVANCVIAAYVIMAFNEDGPAEGSKEKSRKNALGNWRLFATGGPSVAQTNH